MIWIFKNKPKPALGSFDIFERKDDELKVQGWILDPKKKFDSLSVYVDQHRWGTATRMERIDLEKAFPSVSHALGAGFSFIIPIEKIAGKINIRVMGVVDEKEVAQIESIYDISPSVVSIAGSCGVLESDRDWSQYGSNFISDIDLRDEMYQFLSNHPSVKDPEAEYFSSGKSMCNEVEEILTDINRSFRDIKSFLDFASGYGRFTRFLIQKMDRERVFVSDIDKNAVDFCIKTFGVKGFYSVDRPHKLLIEDKYDVIFVASLFSHLAIPLWIDWFNRLYEMVDRDGFFIFSTHGDYCLDMLDQESKKRSKEVLEGFIYLEQSETSRLSLKEYGTAYVNYSFIERQCAKSQIDGKIRFYPRGLWNFQDLYVILK